MSVRIGGSRRWDLGVFCCWAEIVFCKMRGQRSLSGQHYHRTLAATTQNIWYGVSAAMAQCRRRRPGPGPAQLSRTVPTKQSAEGSHHSPSIISVIPEQILQFPEIGRAAWHGDLGRGSSGPDSGGKLQTALCWPQFRVAQEADYYNNNHLVLPSFRELAWRLWLGYGYG